MPNTGRPSGGCHECRRMKIKCDERRPGCARCDRVGRTCPGYREDPGIFIDMTVRAVESAQNAKPRPRSKLLHAGAHKGKRRLSDSPVSAPEEPPAKRASQSPPLGLIRPNAWSEPPRHSPISESQGHSSGSPYKHGPLHRAVLARPMSTDWENAAVSYYMSQFVIYPSENFGKPGYFDFLPDLVKEENDALHLTEALKSVALSAMGNRSCMEQLNVQARRAYVKALGNVNLALSDSRTQTADATLVTLILLGQYEIISGEKPDHSLWTSHGQGQATLLAMRGTDQFRTDRGCAIFRLAQFGCQLSAISDRPTSTPWKGRIPDRLFFHRLGRRLYEVNDGVARTRRETAALMQKTYRDLDWYQELRAVVIRQGDVLDEMYAIDDAGRNDSNLRFWRCKDLDNREPNVSDEDNPNAPLPRYAYTFASLMLAGNMLHFWAIRAKLLEGVLETVELLEDNYVDVPPALAPGALRPKLAKVVDDLCATLPFLLGELDFTGALQAGGVAKVAAGFSALWPLHVLSGLRDLDPARRSWVLDRLTQIGTVYGVRQALHLRDFRLSRSSTAGALDGEPEQRAMDSPRQAWFPISI